MGLVAKLMTVIRTDLRTCCVEGCEEKVSGTALFCEEKHWPLVLPEEREELCEAYGRRKWANVVDGIARDMKHRT